MNIEKFWTITSQHTTHTNDKSTRFESRGAAVVAASSRLVNNLGVEGVIILEAVALVKRTTPPLEVIEIE